MPVPDEPAAVEELADDLAHVDEVEAAIRALRNDADGLYRLERAAKYHLGCSERARALELIAEALLRSLDGRRHWPRHVPFVRFLSNVLRSIASEWRRENSKKRRQQAAIKRNGAEPMLEPDAELRPDDALIERERRDGQVAQVARIEALFEDDQTVSAILEGKKEGMTAQQIRELFDIGDTEYASALRRLRRTVDREFPEGLEL